VCFAPGLYYLENYVTAQQGDLIEIEGFTAPGRFAPNVVGEPQQSVTWRVVGPGTLPEPRRLLPQDLANPANHSEWVEATGVVRSVKRVPMGDGKRERLQFDVSVTSGEFRAFVPWETEWEFDAETWLGAAVRARGVFGSIFDEQRKLIGMELWVQSLGQITVEDPGVTSFSKLPLRTVAALMRFEPNMGLRTRLRGVVTLHDPERGLYLQDSTGSLWVQTPQKNFVPPGTEIDVVGFPSTDAGASVLRDSIFQATGVTKPLAPVRLMPQHAMEGGRHGQLIKIGARVVDPLIDQDRRALALLADGVIFYAYLVDEPSDPEVLPARDSEVELTGICLNQFRNEGRRAGRTGGLRRAVSFQLLMRSIGDIAVIKSPPWWTPERVAWALGAGIVVLLGVLLWVVILQRRVRRQTQIISTQLSKEAQMDERNRIARELHDTLEQDLTGVQMQMDTASHHLRTRPEMAQQTLDSARALLRHSREEARRTLWDLRSTVLDQGDIVDALRSLFSTLHGMEKSNVSVVCLGKSRRLSRTVENHLLRIAQEAVQNSIQHGGAANVDVEVEFRPDELILRIVDNGKGFDPVTVMGAGAGHFGLLGMRERANKLGARLELDTEIGRGTRVEVIVSNPGLTPTPIMS
jgi:signal transduction histidine kinase